MELTKRFFCAFFRTQAACARGTVILRSRASSAVRKSPVTSVEETSEIGWRSVNKGGSQYEYFLAMAVRRSSIFRKMPTSSGSNFLPAW